MTVPSTMPLRVSTSAVWPIWMSLACVSAILISALSRSGRRRARGSCPARPAGRLRPARAAARRRCRRAPCSSSRCCCVSWSERARLIDERLLHRELRAHRLGLAGELLLRRSGCGRRAARRPPATASATSLRDQLSFGQRLVHLRPASSPSCSRPRCWRRSPAAASRSFCSCTLQVRQRRPRAACSFSVGVLQLLLELRVAQLEDHAVGFHLRARAAG